MYFLNTKLKNKAPLKILLSFVMLSFLISPLMAQRGIFGKVFVGKKEKWSIKEKNSVRDGKKLKVVEYRDDSGKLIWKGEVTYGNDMDPIIYKAVDHRSGYEEGHFQAEGAFVMTRKKNSKASEEEKLVWQRGDYMCGLLIADFCRKNMTALKNGKTLDFDILGPSHLRTAGFEVSITGSGNVRGTECHIVTFEPSSLAVSLFVDPSYFYFSKASPNNLIRYVGRHGIVGDKGETIDGTIDYTNWE